MQVACCHGDTNANDPSHVGAAFSRRSALLAGVSSVTAAQTVYPPHAPAAEAGTSDPVTPVNITAKETVELGQSGLFPAASAIIRTRLIIVVSSIADGHHMSSKSGTA